VFTEGEKLQTREKYLSDVFHLITPRSKMANTTCTEELTKYLEDELKQNSRHASI